MTIEPMPVGWSQTRPTTLPPATMRQGRGGPRAGDNLWSVRPGKIWAWLTTQPASFWLICVYLIFEYLHPQIIYPAINVIPWGYTLMALSGLALVLEGRSLRLPTAIGAGMVIYTAVVLLSTAAAWSPAASVAIFPRYFDWLWAFLLIINCVRTERQYFAFIILFMLCSFKMSNFAARTWALRGFSFADWGVTGSPVWFHNSGEFGVQMCVFFPISLAFYLAYRKNFGKWLNLFFLSFPVTAVMGMIASSSRGALVGGACTLAWMVGRTRYRVRAALAALVVAAMVIVATPAEQKARFSAAGEDGTSQQRFDAWEFGLATANEHPVLGIGFGNWSPYRLVMEGTTLLSHNIFIEAMAEMGYVGLSAFLLLIGATFWVNYRTRSMARSIAPENDFYHHMAHGLDGALIGFLGSGFFVTVLYYPFFWVNLALTVGLHLIVTERMRRVQRNSGILRTRRPTDVGQRRASS